MGEPDGTMTIGNKKRLSYGSGHIVVSSGRIASINNISKDRLSAPDLDSFNDYQEAKGLIYYMGQWMTETEGQRQYEKAMMARDLEDARVQRGKIEVARQKKQHVMATTPIVDIRQGGRRITKQDLVVPGKITVVDFYADWCGPCKAADPYLKAFTQDPDVVLRKVDIVSWRTAVTQQWKIRSIPNMRVYDRNGNQIGQPTANLKEVYDNIQKAK
jgi:thioredoxin 1